MCPIGHYGELCQGVCAAPPIPCSYPQAHCALGAGESYAGVYVPLLAQAVLDGNDAGQKPRLRLKVGLPRQRVLISFQAASSVLPMTTVCLGNALSHVRIHSRTHALAHAVAS